MHPHQFNVIRPGTLLKRKTDKVQDFYILTAHYGVYVVAVRATTVANVEAIEIRDYENWDIVRVTGIKEESPS
jgi:hypothetical protein